MAERSPLQYPVFQAFDANGDPLVNGKVEFFDAGTTNQRDTYSDPELTTANPNPVTLNSRGEPESGGGTPINIYLDASPYKIVLKDSDDVTIRTIDDYLRPDVGGSISAPKDPINATDVGTDIFEAVFTDPKSGEVFTIDFQSSNTTTTPTLENTGGSLGALTIKTRDGSALWENAIDGTHVIYYDGTDYLLLDPNFNAGDSGVRTYDSLSGLQSALAGNFDTIYLRGRTSVGDGGEGHFRWDSSNLSTEVGNDEVTAGEGDGGIYVAPASDKTGASGAWVRIGWGFLRAEWWGAKGDGVTDDSTAIQRALDRGVVYLGEATYFIASTLVIPSGSGIVGVSKQDWNTLNQGSLISVDSAVSPGISVGESSALAFNTRLDFVGVRRDGFTFGDAVTGIGVEYNRVFRTSSRSIFIEGFNQGLVLGNTNNEKTLRHSFVDTNVSACEIFILAVNVGDVDFYGGRIGTNGTDTARTDCFRITDSVDSLTAHRLIMAHNSGVQRNVHIANVTSIFWITFDNCDFETASLNSIAVDTNASQLIFRNAWCASAAPLSLNAGSEIKIEKIKFSAGDLGQQNQIQCFGAGKVEILSNWLVAGNVHQQIRIIGGSDINIHDNMIEGASAGIVADLSGTESNYTFKNNHIKSSSNNAITITGTGTLTHSQIGGNILSEFVNHGVLLSANVNNIRVSDNEAHTADTSGNGRGLNVTASVDYYVVTGNDFSDVTGTPLVDNGGVNSVVANNLT